MMSLRFVLESRASLRIISWKTLAVCIAGATLASTIAHAEVPVEVPKATVALLIQQRDANIRWAAFQLIALAIPLLFLFTGLGARLRRMCESISGRRWFWTVTLFVCAYLIMAALIALPFEYFVGYIQPHVCWMVAPDLAESAEGRWRATSCQVGPRIAVNLDSLSIDRQKPASLVALLHSRADSVRLSGDGRLAGVGRSADDDL